MAGAGTREQRIIGTGEGFDQLVQACSSQED